MKNKIGFCIYNTPIFPIIYYQKESHSASNPFEMLKQKNCFSRSKNRIFHASDEGVIPLSICCEASSRPQGGLYPVVAQVQ